MQGLRFLLLEDSLLDAELIEATLSEGEIECELVRVQSSNDFQKALATHSFDLILSDYSLPSFDGISALKMAQECCPQVPFIFVSGALGEELAIETLKSGATDYILKQGLRRLAPSVQRALREAQERRDRIVAQQELQQTHRLLATLIEAAPLAIAVIEPDDTVRVWNRAAENLFGWPETEVLGQSLLLIPEDRQAQYHQIKAALLTGKTFSGLETECCKRDGSKVFVSLSAATFDGSNGSNKAIVFIFEDISQRKLAEAALQESEARFQAFMSHSPAAAWIANREGRLLYLSPTYLRMFQVPQQEILGKRIDEIYSDQFAQQFLDNNRQVFETQQGVEIVEEAPRTDGSIGDFLVYKFPIPQASQAMLLGGVAIDITERKHHEETIRSLLRISEKLNSTLDVDTLLDSLVTEAIALVNAQSGCSGLYTAQGMVTHKYFNHGQVLPLNYVWSTGQGLPGWLILHKVPYLTNDALNDPQIIQELCQHFGVHSALSTPLLNARGEILGFFEIHNKKEGSGFTSSDQEKLVAVSQIAASAIQNALSYRHLQQAEAELQTSEARFRRIFEGKMVPMGIWTRSGAIVEANDALLDLIGYTRQELEAGQINWQAITPAQYRPLDERAMSEIDSQGFSLPFEKAYIHKQGWQIPLLIGGASFIDDANSGVFFALDLTDRKRVEAALRQSEERYRYLAESIPQLVWTATADGTLLDVNQRWLDYTGMTLAQAQSEGWQLIVYPEDVPILSQSWAKAQKTGSYYQAEGRMRRVDGVYRWHLHQAVPLMNEQGQIIKWFGTATDIEEQKQLEQQRDRLLTQERRAREAAEAANRIKDEFLAVLSHELRSPLNPILGWAKLLQRGTLDESMTQRALETIERNAKLQTQLIEDLLDVSRILRGKMALNVNPVDLVATIHSAMETVQLAAEAKEIDLIFEEPSTTGSVSWQVMGDATRLQQIVWNLLSNAIKFTSFGGRVEVRLESFEFSVLSSQLNPDLSTQNSESSIQNSKLKTQNSQNSQNSQSFAQITITDTGKGITSDFLPYVFDYFRQEDSTTTRRFGGLGLGLAIVRYLSELHGGTVKAESSGEGLGTTFTVQLPLLGSLKVPASSRELELTSFPTPNTQLAGVRVLVVDDEADMRELLSAILEQAQVQVQSAASAREALLAFKSFKPDLLISDIGMPTMDGYQLMRQIRALSPENGGQIQAIALSAYAGEYDQKQAVAAGFQQHIAKPVEPNSLIETIITLLGRRP